MHGPKARQDLGARRRAEGLPQIDKTSAAKQEPRDVFLYFIHEAKLRAPAAAMALIERLK